MTIKGAIKQLEEMRDSEMMPTVFKLYFNKPIETIVEALQESKPEWIPCSERLPDMWDERYLVSLAWGGVGVMEYKSTGFHNHSSFTPVPIESIIAWMPLPEPYRKDGD